MKATADKYYERQNLADFRLLSTMGFTEADVAALKADPAIETVMAGYGLDLLVEHPEGAEAVRVSALPKDPADAESWLSRPVLTAGRLPTAADECLGDSSSPLELGDVVVLADENDADTLELMRQRRFTVVGLAESPSYISFQRGNTNIGNGRLAYYLALTPEAFDQEVYTEITLGLAEKAGLSSFSAEYAELVDREKTRLEALEGQRVVIRYDEVKTEAGAELADARRELAEGKQEAEEKLAEAWAEIEDGEREIADGWAELGENQQKLLDGEQALAEGEQELADGRAELAEGEAAYADALKSYQDGKAAYEKGLKDYQSGLAAYNKNAAEIQAVEGGVQALPDLAAAANGLLQAGGGATPTDIQSFTDAADGAMRAAGGGAALLAQGEDAASRQLAAQIEALISQAGTALAMADYAGCNQALQQLAALQPYMAAAVDGAKAQLEAAADALAAAKTKLDKAQKELTDGKKQLEEAAAQLEEARQKLADGERELADARAELADGKKQLAEARAELADAETELADGKAEYHTEKAKAEKEISDAEAEIADGQKTLDELELPEWYINTRDDNPGYSGFESDAGRIDAIAAVIPVFFFLVAALVCLTSMTRMVEDQRTMIGTLKALGYSRGAIAFKYMLYAVGASATGAAVGVVGGFVLFPSAIWSAYGMMYVMPSISLSGNVGLAFLSIGLSVLCTAAATWSACAHELRSVPAKLMRPKAPRAGKRVILERVGPLWRRLSFMQKVTARNLFRYKKRFFMTVIGVAGCTALLLTGFGLRDSISGIVPRQYGDVNRYDMLVALKEHSDDGAGTGLNAALPELGAGLYTGETNVDVAAEGGTSSGMTVYLFVPQHPEQLGDYISLHVRQSGQAIPFPSGDGVVITEKLADRLKAGAGDTIRVNRVNEAPVELKVAGVTENYLFNYIYIAPDTFTATFGETPEYSQLLVNLKDGTDPDAALSRLLEADPVAGGMVVRELTDQFNDMFESLNAVVWLIIGAAAMLAFVVLYNLTNINITERTREIATLKVLGFRSGEVAAYVFRENIVLTLIGTLVGLGLGVFLHDFVIVTAEVDEIMFRRIIEPLSYLWSILFTMLCAALVNWTMQGRLSRVDMVESLKAIE